MTIRDEIAASIAEYGHHIIAVIDNPPPFAYTIGLTATFGYELLICGVPYQYAGVLLNAIATAGTVELDVPVPGFANLPVMFKKANRNLRLLNSSYVCQANRFYGKNVDVVQVVVPDAHGRFPDDPRYDREYMDLRQPEFFMYESAGSMQ